MAERDPATVKEFIMLPTVLVLCLVSFSIHEVCHASSSSYFSLFPSPSIRRPPAPVLRPPSDVSSPRLRRSASDRVPNVMLCSRPFMSGTVPFGCGQCVACRVKRARQWQWRQVFESLTHAQNCFVTLTYGPETLPADGSLEPRELQLFLKRLRERLGVSRVRFFAVGEYGEESLRPHYHLSLFGLSGFELVHVNNQAVLGSELIASCWKKGFVQVGEFTPASAGYVTGYVVKKLRDRTSGALAGLHPEFARMSNRPGIGAAAMLTIARSLNDAGIPFIEETGDVPHSLKVGGKNIPLPRYLMQKLREAIGFTDEYIAEIKAAGTMEKSLEMLALHFSLENPKSPKENYLQDVAQRIENLVKRSKIYSSRKTL